ncbi:MAG: type III pantothenate kinase [Oligoflexia bacterium]|nr:type III pantothenate kinase [Oligoflexia bacterium]
MRPTLMIIYTIDNGNTNPSVAAFDKESGTLLPHQAIVTFETWQSLILSSEHKKRHDKFAIIISSVGKKEIVDWIYAHFSRECIVDLALYRKEKSFLDMPVDYSNSLGEDRLYQSYYLYKKSSTPKVLIDVGTFTTVDYISEHGYEGGYIFPGPQTFLDSYARGANLPVIKYDESWWNLGDAADDASIGKNTSDAIRLAYMLFQKSLYRYCHCKREVWLSGGYALHHAKFIQEQLQLRVHADSLLLHRSLFFLSKSGGFVYE